MHELEIASEGAIELAWSVVASPDGVSVHADGDESASEADSQPRPTPSRGVIADLPRAQASDHREYQRAPGLEQARARARHIREVRHAIECAEIRIRPVKGGILLEPPELMRADPERRDPIGDRLASCALRRAGDHLRGPIRSGYVVSQPGHAYCIQPGPAAQIDQPAARRERGIQPSPHLLAHILNQGVITSRTIVIRGDAIEG